MDALLWALIVVGVVAIVAGVITRFVKDATVNIVVWAVVGIIALVVLGKALMGII